jgi:hypothetical protein
MWYSLSDGQMAGWMMDGWKATRVLDYGLRKKATVSLFPALVRQRNLRSLSFLKMKKLPGK